MNNKWNNLKLHLLKLTVLNNPLKITVLIIIGFMLYGTKPNYLQHKHQVAKLYQNKEDKTKVGLCPFGYDTKKNLSLNLNFFDVYDAGILSFAVYKHELISIGIFGKVFNLPPKLYS